MILQPHLGTPATNEMESYADTCCLGTNFIVMDMIHKKADVYPYNNLYETMYHVPIFTGASTYKQRNTGRLFLIVINEALYYGKKLCYSMINPNRLK